MTTVRLHNDELRALFKVCDIANSGILSAEELTTLLKGLGWVSVTVAHCRRLLEEQCGISGARRHDYDPETGRKLGVTYPQLVNLLPLVQLERDSPAECYHVFKLFDGARRQKISQSDLRAIGEAVTQKPVSDTMLRAIMDAADVDQDGYLSWNEFRHACAAGGAGTENGELELPTCTVIAESDQQVVLSPTQELRMSAVKFRMEEVAHPRGGAYDPQALPHAGITRNAASDEGSYTEELIGNVPIMVHTRKRTITAEDARNALITGFAYGDYKQDSEWKLFWDDFYESMEPSKAASFFSQDRQSITVSGYKYMLQMLGELD